MEEAAALTPETKKIINPRVEIDTSPPFESVKEAVDRFGGSGPWIPHHLLRFAAAHQQQEALEEEAMQLERDVMMKEQQTLNVLKELESAKRFVDGLKFNLIPEMSSLMSTPDQKFETNLSLPSEMFTELNQAKLNLSKTSVDLAAIQASVESLNKKLRQDKLLLERRSKMQVLNDEEAFCLGQNRHLQSIEMKSDHHDHDHIVSMTTTTVSKDVINFEADQFKKMTEASRYEVMKAMAEIERTKNCIRMAEMRLNAAKKMEEAAKAVEAISLAERDYLSSGSSVLDGITLSFDEYKALSHKAKQAEELCKTKFMDTNGLDVPILEKFEETTKENEERRHPRRSKFKLRNSNSGNRNVNVLNGVDESSETKEKTVSGFRSSTSIGDVLSRKFVVQDDVMMETHVENHRERQHQHVSLSQMLKEQSRLILHPNRATSEANVEKQYFIQRKKFGFIQVPIPTKKKVNLR